MAEQACGRQASAGGGQGVCAADVRRPMARGDAPLAYPRRRNGCAWWRRRRGAVALRSRLVERCWSNDGAGGAGAAVGGDCLLRLHPLPLRQASGREAPGASGRGTTPLTGKRILVVEDEILLALKLKDMLEQRGCVVVGPVARLPRALALLDSEAIDGAVLDINLAGTLVFPLAQRLKAEGIPFIFATGYDGSVTYPDDVQDAPRVRKPYGEAQLMGALERAFQGQP